MWTQLGVWTQMGVLHICILQKFVYLYHNHNSIALQVTSFHNQDDKPLAFANKVVIYYEDNETKTVYDENSETWETRM